MQRHGWNPVLLEVLLSAVLAPPAMDVNDRMFEAHGLVDLDSSGRRGGQIAAFALLAGDGQGEGQVTVDPNRVDDALLRRRTQSCRVPAGGRPPGGDRRPPSIRCRALADKDAHRRSTHA